MTDRASFLFVCLGNICRSPLAEAAMRTAAQENGLNLEIDSAGTASYHVGDAPDPRAIAAAKRRGVDISGYRGRQLSPEDYTRFTHIIALDRHNLAEIEARAPSEATARIALLMDAVDGRAGHSVADPYYGDESDFELAWAEVEAGARALVAALVAQRS